MTELAAWFRSGPFLIRERAVRDRVQVDAQVALFTPGWEVRAVAVSDIVDCGDAESRILDFDVPPSAISIIDAQKAKLVAANRRCEAINLLSSIELDSNVHKIKMELRKLYLEGHNHLFVDITSLPKSYIQAITSWLFVEGLFPHVTFGYAEGVYGPTAPPSASEQSVSFECVKPMIGMTAPCREKRLIAVLGGERANCYALIERIAPDYIHLLGTQSENHEELKAGITAQLDKIKIEYGDRLVQNSMIEAFSLRAFLSAIDVSILTEDRAVATTIFAGGTKPHALAAAILAAAHREIVELRYRRPTAYPQNAVGWSGRYFIYEVVDLRSERLPLCKVF